MIAKLKLYWPFALVALGILVWAGFAMSSCSARHREAQQNTVAQQAHEQAVTHAAQGGAHDQQAATAGAAVAQAAQSLPADKATIARLTRERDALLAKLHSIPVQPQPAGSPNPAPVALPPDVVEALAKDGELIQAQTMEIQHQAAVIDAQGTQIISLTAARDSWRSAAEDSQREAVAERLAHEAAQSASRSQRWLGRIEGLAVGLAGGYVGGKIL